ncbi:JAB domain-containing protein [Cytobacillus purgationiresistens]|uniref:DNA repair protein RadC n=1 Tax=Cytobacillus purgationiresistens TaxID=863449 RepID=A0ABU0ATV5_9BACI|nr:JAB domain-containing protein [Cytobacillus purgationiresistens]MDQ0273858.1 DNA repair protein RadC [Cytobacillus purgationiresistens]
MDKIYEVVKIKQEINEIDEFHMSWIADSPFKVVKLISSFIAHEDREVFLVLMLNTRHQVIAIHRASVGSLNASLIHPREIMKAAILNNASSFIVSHQHPSGNTSASKEDMVCQH